MTTTKIKKLKVKQVNLTGDVKLFRQKQKNKKELKNMTEKDYKRHAMVMTKDGQVLYATCEYSDIKSLLEEGFMIPVLYYGPDGEYFQGHVPYHNVSVIVDQAKTLTL